MTAFPIVTLAVMLLSGPDELAAPAAAGAVRPANPAAAVQSAKITSRTSDFDGSAGVVMFEGDVVVRYSADFTMCADRLYMFLSGSNELSRVVAVGSVSVTNGARSGSCEMATYRRRKGEVEMFGAGGGAAARLTERGGQSLEGRRIRFWLGSRQVEVERSKITSQGKGGAKLL